MRKIILDLCGGSGAWSKPYKDANYDVRNITLPDYDVNIYEPPKGVYGILAAPPCQMFSFARMKAKKPRDLKNGMKTVISCLKIIWECQYQIERKYTKKTSLKFWALENPNGFLKYFLGKPAFIFDPWNFEDMYKKKTYLWGYFNNPKKIWFIKPDCPKFSDLKSIYYDTKIWNRKEARSITPQGFAKAFFEANR